MAKIISFKKAVKLAEELRKKGTKIIYTSGCFDILHIGHINFLKRAKKFGGKRSVLFVGVESDGYIRSRKGAHRPIFNQKTRVVVLSNINVIDFVIPFVKANPKSIDYYNKRKLMGKHTYVCGRTNSEVLEAIKKESRELNFEIKIFDKDYDVSTTRIEKILKKYFSS